MENGGIAALETGLDYEVIRNLTNRGHTIQTDIGNFGGYQAIMRHPQYSTWFGASESRKDGQAAGY
jgi:gamma-glutamyltranspeptidase/glutathione hydrolase